jgi:hypothetical protein
LDYPENCVFIQLAHTIFHPERQTEVYELLKENKLRGKKSVKYKYVLFNRGTRKICTTDSINNFAVAF